jgi:GT2 family glycosyltransferase
MDINKYTPKSLIISIVSHGHGQFVRNLLLDLEKIDFHSTLLCGVVVTVNIPEEMSYYENIKLPLRFIHNKQPKGYGANHNYAVKNYSCDYIAVLNPDIRLLADFNFYSLVSLLIKKPGVVGPLVKSSDGAIQDSARKFPTLFSILLRTKIRFLKKIYSSKSKSNINISNVDWVAGMFMVFDSRVFKSIRGFDESYFMYLEDADICRRIRNAGHNVSYATDQCVQHDARRATWNSLSHFWWHLCSLLRFIF